VAGLGRRGRAHLCEVEAEKRLHIFAVEVIEVKAEIHHPLSYFDRKAQEA